MPPSWRHERWFDCRPPCVEGWMIAQPSSEGATAGIAESSTASAVPRTVAPQSYSSSITFAAIIAARCVPVMVVVALFCGSARRGPSKRMTRERRPAPSFLRVAGVQPPDLQLSSARGLRHDAAVTFIGLPYIPRRLRFALARYTQSPVSLLREQPSRTALSPSSCQAGYLEERALARLPPAWCRRPDGRATAIGKCDSRYCRK
jgi:hypothetical protein